MELLSVRSSQERASAVWCRYSNSAPNEAGLNRGCLGCKPNLVPGFPPARSATRVSSLAGLQHYVPTDQHRASVENGLVPSMVGLVGVQLLRQGGQLETAPSGSYQCSRRGLFTETLELEDGRALTFIPVCTRSVQPVAAG